MEQETLLIETNPRLGVYDKRYLFLALMAKTERLLSLNPFPVDIDDFALSLIPIEDEKAWRLIRKTCKSSLSPTNRLIYDIPSMTDSVPMLLAMSHEGPSGDQLRRNIFLRMDVAPSLLPENRFYDAVVEWAKTQHRLEDQVTRTLKVVKGIVTSCNTVGQYDRVSPELVSFLPEKYRLALKEYTKKSPYPAMGVSPEQVDTAMNTLAYAALQPTSIMEENFLRTSFYRNPHYNLLDSTRTEDYSCQEVRSLQI